MVVQATLILLAFVAALFGVLMWMVASHLRRIHPAIQSDLEQVPLVDGRLSPTPDQNFVGVLRRGPIQVRDKSTGELKVITAHALSDDALTPGR